MSGPCSERSLPRMSQESETTAICPDPDHAYVPGQSPRHAADAFHAFRDSIRPGMRPEALCRTQAWCCGLDWLRRGYFWEAHELLEPVWMALPHAAPERQMVQALIQLANAGLKGRMGRPRAVVRCLDRAGAHLERCKAAGRGSCMGLRLDMVGDWIEERRAQQDNTPARAAGRGRGGNEGQDRAKRL